MLPRTRVSRAIEKPKAFVTRYGPCFLFVFCLAVLQLLHKLDHWRDEAACEVLPPQKLLTVNTAESDASQSLMVLGIAVQLKLENILIFCLSFRRFHPSESDRLILFLNEELSEELVAITRLLDITIVKITTMYDLHPSSYRWIEFEKYLAELAPEDIPTYLFHADVRDTAFQSNLVDAFRKRIPWDEKEPILIAMMETGVIKKCGWNSGWIKDCFGNGGLKEVEENIISCSGTTLGSWLAMKQYVSVMADSIKERKECERNGVDQGMHNYFINTAKKSLPGVSIIRSNEIVIQVQTTETLESDILGRIKNSIEKDVFAVVHQYDRSGWLHKRFLDLYPVNTYRRARAKGPRLKQ